MPRMADLEAIEEKIRFPALFSLLKLCRKKISKSKNFKMPKILLNTFFAAENIPAFIASCIRTQTLTATLKHSISRSSIFYD